METKFVNENDYCQWDKFCYKNKCSTFLHTTHAMKYYMDSSFNIKTEQKSFFVLDKRGEVIGCMPVFLEMVGDKKSLSYGGSPLLAPIIENNLSKKNHKKVLEYILDELDELALTNDIKRIELSINPLNVDYIKENHKSNYLIRYGFLDTSIETCILDLSHTLEELFVNFSKGHKSAVKKGEKNLDIEIINSDNVTKEDVYVFMDYYFKIAGKITRPQNTFDNIYNWIKEGYGTLFISKYENMICGYSLIYMYKDTAYYVMACKEQDYSQFNIAHFIQWEIIKYLKEKKIRFYELGIQDFNDTLHQNVSEKDKNISLFKRGFGGFIIPIFRGEKFYDLDEFKKIYIGRINKYAERNFREQ